MLSRKKWKQAMQKQEKKSALYVWIQTQLSKINYDLSDHYCKFYIKNVIQQKGISLIIELYVQPLTGTFDSIQFRPKIFISSVNFTNRPHIYNDRRLFHPNINMYTCQIVFPEIIKEWNPTQEFNTIFHSLKYTLIQPNLKFVPNTQFNKRAAWHYHFNKKNYRTLIIQHSPLYLENLIGHEFDIQHQNRMEIEGAEQNSQRYNQKDYWSIQVLTGRKSTYTGLEEEDMYDEDQKSILQVTKQIKCLDMNEGMQNEQSKYLAYYQSMRQ